jgi:phosphoadenosine phosphosulfate reductase
MITDFTKGRTKTCEELMRPEVKELLNLSLDEKIEKSKKIIRDAIEKYPKIGLGFSGGTDSLILLHLVLQIKPNIPVVFVDTQHDAPETYAFIDKTRREWQLINFKAVMAEKNRVKEFAEKFGMRSPEFTEICCNYHKISPMMKAIGEDKFDAFFVGLRGVEHEERAKESIFSIRHNPEHFRVHPLIFWKRNDVMDYVKKFNLECNPLYKQGYTSLGCVECTDKNPDPNMHERAGRGEVRETIMQRLRELGYT